MDLAAEFELRLTGSQTDELPEPVGNPWAGPMETTTTERESLHTPLADDDLRFQDQLSDSSNLLGPAIKLKLSSEDSTLEQEHLRRQLKSLALEVKRIRSQAAASKALEKDVVVTANWSSRELKLVQGAVKRWRRMGAFKMAEQILKGAVDIREANVIA
jgi:kinesin family protein 1